MRRGRSRGEDTTGYRARHGRSRSSDRRRASTFRSACACTTSTGATRTRRLCCWSTAAATMRAAGTRSRATLRHDWHVVAPDLRGHGDSAWAIGSSYAIAELVLDLAQLLGARALRRSTIVAPLARRRDRRCTTPARSRSGAQDGRGRGPRAAARDDGGSAACRASKRVRDWVSADAGARRRASRAGTRRSPPPPRACARRTRSCPRTGAPPHGPRRRAQRGRRCAWKFDNYTRSFAPARFTDDERLETRGPHRLSGAARARHRELGEQSRARRPRRGFTNARVVEGRGRGTLGAPRPLRRVHARGARVPRRTTVGSR